MDGIVLRIDATIRQGGDRLARRMSRETGLDVLSLADAANAVFVSSALLVLVLGVMPSDDAAMRLCMGLFVLGSVMVAHTSHVRIAFERGNIARGLPPSGQAWGTPWTRVPKAVLGVTALLLGLTSFRGVDGWMVSIGVVSLLSLLTDLLVIAGTRGPGSPPPA